MRKHRRGRSGQALIEFVMIGSVFFTVVFFGVFYGHYINVKSLLNVASYSAARKFAITQNIDLATQAANLYVARVALPDSVVVEVDNDNPDFGEGFMTTVYMDIPVPMFAPLMAILGGGPGYTISSSTPMSAE